MEDVFDTNISNVDEFNVFIRKGIEIANTNKDKLLKSFLKNVEAFINEGQFEIDPQKSLKAFLFQKEDYKEREEFLEALTEIINKSDFAKYFLGSQDQGLLAILLLIFQKQGKVINFKRLNNSGLLAERALL